jgi:hypothetical protein
MKKRRTKTSKKDGGRLYEVFVWLFAILETLNSETMSVVIRAECVTYLSKKVLHLQCIKSSLNKYFTGKGKHKIGSVI